MKTYYYLLFRLYDYYLRVRKEDAGLSLYFTVTASTLIVYFSLVLVVSLIDYLSHNFFNLFIPNKYFIIAYLLVIGFLNYLFFIKNKKFLTYNFRNDKKGGYAIILYIIILGIVLIFFANVNREKIFKEREKGRMENKE